VQVLRVVNRITPPVLWDLAKRLVRREEAAAPGPFMHESVGSYSQFGEDLVIDALLGCPSGGVYVDVGANDPDELSNTKRFYERGWRGVNIEPNTSLWEELERKRPEDTNLNIGVAPTAGVMTFYRMYPSTLSTFDAAAVKDNLAHPGARMESEVQVAVEPLSQVLGAHAGDGPVDFLSVDTEGLDLAVLKSNDWRTHRPRLVLVEIAWRGQDIIDYLREQKYTFVWSNGVNGIFVDADNSL
jgi:FkbM family methyltransferase